MLKNKKFFILIIAIYTCITTHAQIKRNGWYYIPLPMNDSAEWCVVYQDGQHKDPAWRSFRYYKTKGDTFISGQTYKKVWTNTEHHKYHNTDTLVCMYRQDTAARRVFVRSAYTYYPDTNEYLVMDFGVKDSDTMMLPVFTRKGVYELRKFYIVGVDSQKTIVGEWVQKVYYDRITYLANTPDTAGLVYGDMWHPLRDYFPIEGVGSTRSMGPFFYPIARKEYYYMNSNGYKVDTVAYVHCIENKGYTWWIDHSSPWIDNCGYIIDVIPFIKEKQSLKMFPNPCSEYIDIQFDNAIPNLQIEIIDINGKQVIAPNKTIGNTMERISTINLIPGIYIMRLYNNLEYSESYKIIRQ